MKDKVKVKFLRDDKVNKKGNEIFMKPSEAEMYLRDGDGLIEIIKEKKPEVEERKKQIKIINAKNMMEKTKLNDRELYVIGHEQEDIVEAREQLEEEKEEKDSVRSLKKMEKELPKVYESITKLIKYYMDMPEDQIRIVVTWIIGTYFHSSFSTYPFLFINAMRGSGKTRLLRLISHLASKCEGEVQTGMSEAVLFRMPTGHTLVLDEIESIGSKEKGIFREYLNACYKIGGSVSRMKKSKGKDGEGWEIEKFKPYKPIAMANIWGMDEVLGDRCVTFVLEKSSVVCVTKKVENFEHNELFSLVKSQLNELSVVCVVLLQKRRYLTAWNNFIDQKYNYTNTHTTYTTYTTYTTLFEEIDNLGIDGRNFELLFPLLLVSHLIGEKHFVEMLRVGKELMDAKKLDEYSESPDVSVYEFVAKQPSNLSYVAVKELTSKFKIFRGEEEWINEKWLGRSLKRLNLVLQDKRMASGKYVMLNIVKAKDKLQMFSLGKEE